MTMEKATKELMGIYQVKNTTNGHVYVGSSLSIHNRFSLLFSLLASGRCKCVSLQKEWDTIGVAHFTFSILELLKDKYAIEIKELEWMKKLRATSIDNKSAEQFRMKYPNSVISINKETHSALRAMNKGTFDDTIRFLIHFADSHGK